LDKLEMMFQAYKYGKDQPQINLQEFWDYIQAHRSPKFGGKSQIALSSGDA
jgi:hypothetical protein